MHPLIRTVQDFFDLCLVTGLKFPYSEDISCLATPLPLGRKAAPNRIVYQAMEGCDGTRDGEPGELTLRRYLRFARGGAGVIWVEATACMQEGRANPHQLSLNEKTLPAFARLCDQIRTECQRENGFAPILILQATHSGRYAKPNGFPEPRIA